MKRFYFLIPLVAGCLVALLLGAGDPYTAYFPNINVATNVTIGGVLTVGPTNVIDELALKAPLASPALTGTPTINGNNIPTNWVDSGTSDATLAGTASAAEVDTTTIKAGAVSVTNNLTFTGVATAGLIPRSLTTAQKNALGAPPNGAIVYDSDLGRNQMWDGAAWHSRVRLDGDTMTGCLIAPGIQEQIGVISHAGTATLNFSPGANANKLVLTGAVTIAFSNLETNRYYHLMVANAQATNCSYVLPAVKFMGYYPTNIVAGKTAEWFFKVDPQTNSIVYAKYVEQQ